MNVFAKLFLSFLIPICNDNLTIELLEPHQSLTRACTGSAPCSCQFLFADRRSHESSRSLSRPESHGKLSMGSRLYLDPQWDWDTEILFEKGYLVATTVSFHNIQSDANSHTTHYNPLSNQPTSGLEIQSNICTSERVKCSQPEKLTMISSSARINASVQAR